MNAIRIMMNRLRPLVRARRRVFGPKRPTWGEDFELVAAILRHSANFSVLLPLSMQRAMIDPKRPDSPVVKATRITSVDVGGLPGQWFDAPGGSEETVVVYLHGGGYSVGSIRSHRDLISRVAHAARSRVLAVDYRLAPEHPFPAQIDDGRTIYRWLRERGYPPARIAFAGESAGGGLCLSTMLALRDAGEPLPAAAVLISPWVDLEARGQSFHENRRYDFVTRKAMLAYSRRFVREHQLRHPLAAPIHADLHGLPPILIQVGQIETLRDDGVALARRIEDARGSVTLEVWPDMIHAFHVFAPIVPEARDAIDRLGKFIAEALAAGNTAAA